MSEDKKPSQEMTLIKLNGYVGLSLSTIFYMCTDGQVKPDGRPCTICGDAGHLAMTCKYNAFKLFEEIVSSFSETPLKKERLWPNNN